MTIGRKLYYGFGAILALLVLLFIVNITAILREHSARADVAAALDTVRSIEAVRFQMMQNELFLRNYLLSGDQREDEKVRKGQKELAVLIKRAQAKTPADEARASLNEVETTEQAWADDFAKPLIEKRQQVDAGNATVSELQVFYLQRSPGALLAKSSAALDVATASIRKALEASTVSAEHATTLTTVASSLFTLLAILAGVGVAYYTARSIIGPLNELMTVSREIAESGDLDQSIRVLGNDEIGALGRTFNNMVSYLKEMAAVSAALAEGELTVSIQPRSSRDTLANAFLHSVQGLRQMVRQVRESGSQVAAGSSQVAGASDEAAKVSVQASAAIDEVTSTMQEMSINVQNVVKNTQVQASSVSETSASIDQMVASIERVADTAKVLLEISHRSQEEVHSGIATMERATEGLNRTNHAILASAEIVGVLGHRADDIGKIIEVIDDLAEQTNLLALNAAIEAARAGEHGLGFAVVADEVRKLAEKSTQSTKEISELIQSIQKEAHKAVENMENSTTLVEEGLTLSNSLGLALQKIAGVVGEVFKFSQEIGAATHQQANGSAQIGKATTRLNEITQEINSSVEEQATGVQAVVRAMEKMRDLVQQSTSSSTELAAASEQMSKMSRALLESMDRFAIDTDAREPRRGPERSQPREGRREPKHPLVAEVLRA